MLVKYLKGLHESDIIMKNTRIISTVLLLLMLFSILSLTSCDLVNSAFYFFGKNYIFTETEGGYVVQPIPISTSLEGLAKKVLTKVSIEIPSEYKGEPVVGIKGFSIYPALVDVTIPDTIKYIEVDAFGPLVQYNEYADALYLGNDKNPYVALIKVKKTDITSIEIHPDTKCIANERVFSDCTALTSITFKGNVPSFPYNIIPCLSTIILDDGVTSVENGAFEGCASLTNLTIGKSVEYIDSDAFNGCNRLSTITLRGEWFRKYFFDEIPRLNTIIIENGVTEIGNQVFSGCKSLESVTIPDSVTSIGPYAFANCTALKSITIPDAVTSIGSYAFANCTSLENLTIGESVTSIGDHAFKDCTSLKSVKIPSSVTIIEKAAFDGCSSMTKVVFEKTWDWYFNSHREIPRHLLEAPDHAADALAGSLYGGFYEGCFLRNYTWKRR